MYLLAQLVLTMVTICTCDCSQPYRRGAGGLADFGGDYGEYLNLLEGNDVLDDFGGGGLGDIEEGQARQEAVMGGEEEELKDGFLRRLKLSKKNDKKQVHFHFDVNVLVLNNNMTAAIKPTVETFIPNLDENIKFLERETDASEPESFDWKKLQVEKIRQC